jgi:glycosyltransferase involved in cell wall biosynthesis
MLTRSLVRQALARQPQVIHFFKPKAYAGLAHVVLWGLRRWGGKQLRLVLDSDDWEQAWNEIAPYSPLQKRFFTWQERWGLRHADVVTVASRAIQALVGPYTAQTPVFYVPNGYRPQDLGEDPRLELERVAAIRQKWQLGTSPTILLYSRFWEFRLERLLSLVSYVAEHLPSARWLLVGQGLQGEEKRLENLLKQAGLAEFVHFTGWPVADLSAYFQTAAVAVHPYDDTLINRTKCSVKVVELLARGRPLIVDAVGQNCEYIEAGVSGVLIPAEDDQTFGQAIVALLQDPARQARLGQMAAQRMQEKFTWSTLCQIVEEAYSCEYPYKPYPAGYGTSPPCLS